MQTTGGQRITESARDVILPDDIEPTLWTVFSGEGLVHD